MNTPNKGFAASLALSVLLALIAAGCATTPKPKPWSVQITKTTPASITVDLIGVTASQRQFYEGLSWDAYWPNTQVRRDADKLSQVLQWDQPWIVSRTDPQWQRWISRGATELLIIANLPEPTGLWKVALPLDAKTWRTKEGMIEIEVQDTVIRVLTPQKVGK